MTGSRSTERGSSVTPDMNVTPLVDVVLVLLIIFMVVAPRMDQDVPVELPGIFNPDPEVDVSSEPIKLTVAKEGEYYIGQEKYDLDGAIETLSAAHAAEPLRRLTLRADAKLTYAQVRGVLARAQQVGFPGMSLLVGERSRGRPGDSSHEVSSQEPAAGVASEPAPADEG